MIPAVIAVMLSRLDMTSQVANRLGFTHDFVLLWLYMAKASTPLGIDNMYKEVISEDSVKNYLNIGEVIDLYCYRNDQYPVILRMFLRQALAAFKMTHQNLNPLSIMGVQDGH
jgi:hypothetical protein